MKLSVAYSQISYTPTKKRKAILSAAKAALIREKSSMDVDIYRGRTNYYRISSVFAVDGLRCYAMMTGRMFNSDFAVYPIAQKGSPTAGTDYALYEANYVEVSEESFLSCLEDWLFLVIPNSSKEFGNFVDEGNGMRSDWGEATWKYTLARRTFSTSCPTPWLDYIWRKSV